MNGFTVSVPRKHRQFYCLMLSDYSFLMTLKDRSFKSVSVSMFLRFT